MLTSVTHVRGFFLQWHRVPAAVPRSRGNYMPLCITPGQLAATAGMPLCALLCSPVAARRHCRFGCPYALFCITPSASSARAASRASALTATRASACRPASAYSLSLTDIQSMTIAGVPAICKAGAGSTASNYLVPASYFNVCETTPQPALGRPPSAPPIINGELKIAASAKAQHKPPRKDLSDFLVCLRIALQVARPVCSHVHPRLFPLQPAGSVFIAFASRISPLPVDRVLGVRYG